MRLTYGPKASVACIRLLLNANERLTQDDGKFVFVDPRSGEEKTLKVA